MRKILDGLYQTSFYAAACFIVGICLIVIAQVGLNLADKIAKMTTGEAIGMTIPSYADFTGFFLAAASFLALAGTLREGGHIRVTLVTGLLPKSVQRIFELGAICLALAVTSYATWYSFKLVHESWSYNDLSPGMVPVPLWIPQISIAIGLAVLTIALADELVTQLRGADASWEGKGENLLAGNDTEEAG